MGFRNSPAYTQRQIDTILADLRAFARAFIDDVITASKTLEEHTHHLRSLFQRLVQYNIALNPQSALLDIHQRLYWAGMSTLSGSQQQRNVPK